VGYHYGYELKWGGKIMVTQSHDHDKLVSNPEKKETVLRLEGKATGLGQLSMHIKEMMEQCV
jgi:hypothetical protein